MKLLIVDDHLIFLQGASYIFKEVIEGATVSTASSAKSAIMKLREDPGIDIVLMDLEMPDAVGVSSLMDIRREFPLVPIIILSATEDPKVVETCLKRGAAGFIPKSYDAMAMLVAIEKVMDGGKYIPQHLDMTYGSIDQAMTHEIKLTARQKQVLAEIARGLSNKAIAERLSIAENTVKVHVVTIYKLLGVDSRIGCIRKAEELALLT